MQMFLIGKGYPISPASSSPYLLWLHLGMQLRSWNSTLMVPLNVGCSPEQIIETFIHVTIYAGFPAALNAVSVARKVFAERGIDLNLDTHSTEPAKRFEVGSSFLERVDGAGGEAVVESLQDIAPDLGRYIVEYSFGDVYSRPGLSLWERELVSVSVCSALGTCVPQLHVHINGFLNVGGTQDELVS